MDTLSDINILLLEPPSAGCFPDSPHCFKCLDMATKIETYNLIYLVLEYDSRCQMVSGSVRWCHRVSDGVGRCQVVSGGVRLCQGMSDGLRDNDLTKTCWQSFTFFSVLRTSNLICLLKIDANAYAP